ncbi:hypothetical protein F4553_001059 [Allocatelliglobosispora scoriae]|uniref:Uncharacterized protein n=1 Tax=Allocatelliglobosispora scoriae TaxID=643052 RepID=A0A841BLI5_9ACTN|nr:hypothetical protein [Allocatelliglobosispora scoriae]MBB5867680.1 hypothetical protein [Allocatelliglobosispora scoriae]
MHGFDSPFEQDGWLGGHLVFTSTEVTFSVDADGAVALRSIPLAGATVSVGPPTVPERRSLGSRRVARIVTGDGRSFAVAVDHGFEDALQPRRAVRSGD